MTTLAESLGGIRKPWQWMAIGAGVVLVWAVISTSLHRSSDMASGVRSEPMAGYLPRAATRVDAPQSANEMKQLFVAREQAHDAISTALKSQPTPAAVEGRKIIRTTSISMIVQNPADVAEKITALAESMGGYLERADGGGENATSGSLTIRVPAARFEQARAEIRKLGVRVENEQVEAQDVTRQYVDQDANLRNLRAEEAGYLEILKQAHTVKDMLAVSEQLSNVRGQIEEQQAEFNALSRQIETVAISISLRKEVEPQVMGIHWRPGYQLRLAFRDGMDSIGDYAAAMTTILFNLPAALLWIGTILGTIVAGWKIVIWGGRRWFGWKPAEPAEAK